MSYYRPPTGGRASGRGTRLPTGRGGFRLGTGMRPGSKAGMIPAGGALNSQITIPDRPVTQQGLGGMKTGMKGGLTRQVQDKSYYLGILRTKMGELNTEILKLSHELEQLQRDGASYFTYEKRAGSLAAEVEELRGQLADYNMLIDKLNTDTELDTILSDYNTLCHQNEVETRAIDVIFAEKQNAELQLNQLETNLEQEKQFIDTLIESMDPEIQETYHKLKTENARILKDVKDKERELDRLVLKAERLEEELASSDLKQQAFHLHQQLQDVIAKRDDWRSKEDETPEEERERLLKQVKQDNKEIASLERRINELQDSLEKAQDALRKIESDLEQTEGERIERVKGLLSQEKLRKEFLDNFETEKDGELTRICELEETIVGILDHISQTMLQSENIPTVSQMYEMQEDLLFKEVEMKRAASTAENLEAQNSKLMNDLTKIEELENKIQKELLTLRTEIETMTDDIKEYSDLNGLQVKEEEKNRALRVERENLIKRKEMAKESCKPILEKYEAEKSQLEKNDTFTQLMNLESKLQHLEQNNFVLKEFVATRQSEGNYKDILNYVMGLQRGYNSLVIKSL